MAWTSWYSRMLAGVVLRTVSQWEPIPALAMTTSMVEMLCLDLSSETAVKASVWEALSIWTMMSLVPEARGRDSSLEEPVEGERMAAMMVWFGRLR